MRDIPALDPAAFGCPTAVATRDKIRTHRCLGHTRFREFLLVYTIAAYTITLGALALYGVVMQHRLRVSSGALAATGGGPVLDPRKGFNVGAALLAPFWMLAHGMRLPGVLLSAMTLALVPFALQAMWVPFLFVALVPLAAGAVLSFLGNRIGVAHTGLEDVGAFSTTQIPWAIAGVLLYTVILPWAWYFTAGNAVSN